MSEPNYETTNQEKTPLMVRIKNMPLAYYLVAINVLVFIILHLSNQFIEVNFIINHFAKYGYSIAVEHEYYRFFTAIFIHESISHLFFNCFAILVLSKPIEVLFGKTKFIIIFIISGLFGSLFSFIFSPAVSIGASGGVFGFFGVHLYLFVKNKSRYLEIFGKDMLQLLVINLLIGFLIPNVDYWGHIGGIVGGIIATFTLGINRDSLLRKSVLSIGVSLLIFLGLFIPFQLSYTSYIELIDEQLILIEQGINSSDTDLIKAAKSTILEEQPFLPPVEIESLIKIIDDYIEISSQ